MKRFSMQLETNSINAVIKELEKYRDSLVAKSELLVSRLLDEGIKVAYEHLGRYTGYVEFSKEIESGKKCIGFLIGKDTQPFISTWQTKEGVQTVEVSGLLMSEFGSGWLANVIWDVSGVGQGTFPGQTHAFDYSGWYWTDIQGKTHFSKGEQPHYPMYFADMTMLSQIDKIAREVFADGI